MCTLFLILCVSKFWKLTGPAWRLSWGGAVYPGSCWCIFHCGHLSRRPGTYQTSPALTSALPLCSSWHTQRHKPKDDDLVQEDNLAAMSGCLTFRFWHSLDLTDNLSCSPLQKSLDAPDQIHFLQNTQSHFWLVCHSEPSAGAVLLLHWIDFETLGRENITKDNIKSTTKHFIELTNDYICYWFTADYFLE